MKQITLYAKSSKDKTKQWSIQVDKNSDGSAIITTFHGEKDGALTRAEKNITTGKNLGKSNETSPYEQAVKDAESKVNKKRDKGYYDTESSIIAPVLPMLALKYQKRGHDIIWPAFIQPKLNGVRCMAHIIPTGIELLTRMGKIFEFSNHIRLELINLFNTINNITGGPKEVYLDGELFKHGMPLQDIVRATRKQSGTEDKSHQAGMEYHIYDCFDLKSANEISPWSFKNRIKYIKECILKTGMFRYIKLVPTTFVASPKQALNIYDTYIQNNYEGGILRNAASDYKLGHRSKNLQKIKQFFDAEYEIIGAFEGTGTEESLVNWICKTPEGREFNVRPRGTFDERRKLWTDRQKYYGKMLTVTYQEKTNDGIPHICVGTGIRDYE